MKRTELLFVLASPALLTGCFSFGGGLKKVEFDEFAKGLTAAVKNNEFVKKDGITSSKEGSLKGKLQISQSVTSGSKETNLGSLGFEINLNAKGDINNKILYVEMELMMSTEQQSSSQKYKYQIQKGDSDKFIFIDIFKETYAESEITDFKYFLNYVPGLMEDVDFDEYLTKLKENEQFEKYVNYFTFSMNEKQFAIELDGDHEVKEDDKVLGTIKSNKSKVYLDLTDGKESATANLDILAREIAQEDGTAHAMTGGKSCDYKAGDYIDIKLNGEGTLNIVNADVSLTKIDVSSFTH